MSDKRLLAAVEGRFAIIQSSGSMKSYDRLTAAVTVERIWGCQVPIRTMRAWIHSFGSRVQNCEGSGVENHPHTWEYSQIGGWSRRMANAAGRLTHRDHEVHKFVGEKRGTTQRRCQRGEPRKPMAHRAPSVLQREPTDWLADRCPRAKQKPRWRAAAILGSQCVWPIARRLRRTDSAKRLRCQAPATSIATVYWDCTGP